MISYTQLQKELGLSHELPITVEWSAAADFLNIIKNHCIEYKPQTIVECSSGLTSIILGRCCQINKFGKVFSLENGEEYKLKTSEQLNTFSLDKEVDVIYAPLQKVSIDNINYDWYTTTDLDSNKIDMLVIDGPPGFIQKHSRFPALPLLFDRLVDDATIFLDDASRNEERELVAMWLAKYPNIKHEYIETERGCSILTLS